MARTGIGVTLTGNQIIGGDKTFSGGVAFQKGGIFYGQYTPFPVVAGGYIALYKSTTYNTLRILGYNGSAYQDVALGALLGSTFPLILKANGTTQLNVGSDATGDMYYRNASGVLVRMGIGTNGKILTTNGTIPSWGNTINSSITIDSTGGNYNSLIYSNAIEFNRAAGNFIKAVSVGGTLAFTVSKVTSADTQVMTVTGIGTGGSVGIGEISPDYTLDVNGTFGFTPGSSVTPVDNGDVVFQLTSNTQLTVKAKGSDGVIRSGNITLA